MDPRILLLLAISAHLCVNGSEGQFLTQTVYGFLDFTTTIGNTVMVFSPQSAPPPEPPSTEKPVQENIIDTKPPPTVIKPEAIKPSKLSEKENTKKAAAPPVIASAISVVTSPPKKAEKPAIEPKPVIKEVKQVISKIEVVSGASSIVETPKQVVQKQNKPAAAQNKKPQKPAENVKNISSKIEVEQEAAVLNTKLSSGVEIKSSEPDEEEPAILINNNNIGEPEYDFLSRQPSEFVEETYKVINLRPSKVHGPKPKHKNRPPTPPPEEDDDEHPLGLVTTLRGTIVRDGLTTIHETSVIGTFISGKYAQVLNSNSKILGQKAKITPSPPQRILKTPAPGIPKNNRYNLEPTPSGNDETSFENSSNKNNRRQTNNGSSFKNRHQNNQRIQNPEPEPPVNENNQGRKYKNRNASQRTQSTRYGRPSPQLATVSVFSETPAPSSFSSRKKNNNRNNNSGHKAAVTPSNNDSQSRRGFKPRVQPSAVEHVTPSGSGSTSVYKFKLNRAPGSGRWQYKTSPKPKVTIRKMNGEEEPQTTPNPNPLLDDPQSNDILVQSRIDNDLELSGSHSGPGSLIDNETDDNSIEKPPPVETIKVDISTPTDFKDFYYEIATLRSPYTFQVGRVKNTRIITVTTTIKKTIEPTLNVNTQTLLNEPLTENILATATPYNDRNLDSSIETLPAITLSPEMATPPLETFTETFSTTQNLLKTQLLPVVKDDNIKSTLTLVQTYHITRFVTATKTLPPMDFYQFIPSKTLKEFNSRLDEAGSELHLELDFGDSNEEEDGVTRRVFPSDLDLANVGSDFDLTEVDKYRVPDNHLRLKKAHGQSNKNQVTDGATTPLPPALTPEQAQQLALLRLLNPAAAAQIPNVVTTSKKVLKYETVYETVVIPYFNGKSTVHSTISRPVATLTKTDYEIGTSNLPSLNNLQTVNPLNPLNQLNPLFPQQQQFSLTSTQVVLNTEVTATDSQVLKLTFGAKTVYTTLYSTRVVPTQVTQYVTSTVLLPSANFPGLFPNAPFAPFPYVG